jgi:hypothetical protein
MATTPNTNMVTANIIITLSRFEIEIFGAQTKYNQIPPIGNLLVYRHESSMDIRLFREGPTSLNPDLFAIIKEGVGKDSRDRCK